ncbi:hypothetical protein ACFPYI_04775 [Halomarina salina]|uniref:DUF7311 domain-containing protein n=1 Tax=Halomarina salina TaxID=1872699 RepID=A0ABD5RJJ8_9EURY|nr:hypothetical protein [Halomarina salina]
MALRVVLAVLLTLALLAVSLPAVDDARSTRAATALDDASERVRATGERLAATSDPALGETAARHSLRLDLPTRGWGARSGRLRLRDGRVAWRVGDGQWHVDRLPSLVVPDGPLVVVGRARLVLSHRHRAGRSVVVVRRGFKSENATTAARDLARPLPRRDRRGLSLRHLVRR